MTRGEIYRTTERVPERGDRPGYYVVVSRAFVAENEDVGTVVCAPVYSERPRADDLGIALGLPPIA